MRLRFDNLTQRAASLSVTARRQELLSFLASVPDDPENCVTTKAEEQLVAVEGQLIQLKLMETPIAPDWLYQCYRIDPKTQQCAGGSPYEDAIPRDTNEVLRTGHALPVGAQSATVLIAPEVGCRVRTISVSEFSWFFVKGHPPRILHNDGGSFQLASLKAMRTPVLIASIQCDDGLRYRKAAWLLRVNK